MRAIVGIGLPALIAGLLIWLLPDSAYPWVKALHVISVIAWMAALLYLPRLFVYHAEAPAGSEQTAVFKVMELRLMRGIMNPAMGATWVFGLWLAWRVFQFQGGWLHAKLALVLLLSGLHAYYAGALRRFAEDRNTRSARHWRLMNEAPAVLMAIIVVLVIVKPF